MQESSRTNPVAQREQFSTARCSGAFWEQGNMVAIVSHSPWTVAGEASPMAAE